MTEISVSPHLEPESMRVAARPPSLAPALAAQRPLEAFVETMPDGTRVLYRTDGMPIRQWNVDGSIVSFDGQGRPVTQTTAGDPKHPAPAVDGPSHPLPSLPATAPRTPLLVDQRDGQARPVGVTFPDGTRAQYEYRPDGGRVVHYSTGVVTTESGTGRIVAERLPDGTVLNAFDRDGRAIGGTAPGGGQLRLRQPLDAPALPPGAPAVVDPGGPVVRQVTANGTVFDGFDGQGRPTSGVSPEGNRFTMTYDAKGDAFQQFANGPGAKPSAAGPVVQQVTAGGTVFDGFDGQGRPTSGASPGGARFTTTYDPKADSSQRPASSGAGQPTPAGLGLPPGAPDAAVRDAPAGGGAPTSGALPDGTPYTTTYDAKGDSFQHFADGSTVEYSPTGRVIQQVALDGTVVDGFDGQGRPTSGTLPDGSRFTTTYDAKGDTFQHFADGTTVASDPNGHPLKTWTAEGAEITWSVDVPALANAAARVATEQQLIANSARSLYAIFTQLEGIWTGPAGQTLHPLAGSFQTITDELVALLDDAAKRMRTAYQNYVSTEATNTSNLQ